MQRHRWLYGHLHHPAGRNPLTGLSGLQLPNVGYLAGIFLTWTSQSPYGAKRFATGGGGGQEEVPSEHVAIPLRGYVVCNLMHAITKAKRRATMSQSPYGAMWFATLTSSPRGTCSGCWSRNPLTGLCGLQPEDLCGSQRYQGLQVAIPLRGYVVCNMRVFGNERPIVMWSQSPYGAMWFATSPTPPESWRSG